MIIKLIAETEAERKRFGGTELNEHYNCKEYFIVGNKLDGEGSIVDFHEWNGSFRYLLGTLKYFYEIINDDRRRSLKQEDSELPVAMGKNQKVIPMIKRGTGGKIQPIDISKLRTQATQGQEPSGIAIEDEFDENNVPLLKIIPVEEDPIQEPINGFTIDKPIQKLNKD